MSRSSFKRLSLIPKRGNKCIQRMQMISKIFAWHFSPRAKVPNSGSAGNVRAVCGTDPIRRPFRSALVGCCLMRREISSGSSASPANRSVAKALPALSDFVVDVPEDMTKLIHLAIPCHFPAGARGREPNFPAMLRRFARKMLILQDIVPQTEKIFPVVSRPAGKFANVGAGPAIAPYSASLPATRSSVAANVKRKTASGTRTDK